MNNLIAVLLTLFLIFGMEFFLWNFVLVALFPFIPTIGFWQMVGIHMLTRLLFAPSKNKE